MNVARIEQMPTTPKMDRYQITFDNGLVAIARVKKWPRQIDARQRNERAYAIMRAVKNAGLKAGIENISEWIMEQAAKGEAVWVRT